MHLVLSHLVSLDHASCPGITWDRTSLSPRHWSLCLAALWTREMLRLRSPAPHPVRLAVWVEGHPLLRKDFSLSGMGFFVCFS